MRLAVVALVLALAGCGSGAATAPAPTSGTTESVLGGGRDLSLGGAKWVVEAFVHGDVVGSTRTNAWIVFNDKTITVFFGCNEGTAQYQVSGQRLVISGMVTTARPCPYDPARTEEAILTVLDHDVEFKIDGTTLTLTNPSGADMRLTAK